MHAKIPTHFQRNSPALCEVHHQYNSICPFVHIQKLCIQCWFLGHLQLRVFKFQTVKSLLLFPSVNYIPHFHLDYIICGFVIPLNRRHLNFFGGNVLLEKFLALEAMEKACFPHVSVALYNYFHCTQDVASRVTDVNCKHLLLYWTPRANFLCSDVDMVWWLGGLQEPPAFDWPKSFLLAKRLIAENILRRYQTTICSPSRRSRSSFVGSGYMCDWM